VQQQTSAVYAQQYKAILVPLLLAVGSLLVLIGLLCFFCSGPSVDPTTGEPLSNPPLLGPHFKWFGMIAGPMGLILLVGSYLFHMELSKQNKK
jgi:hypothetical protein